MLISITNTTLSDDRLCMLRSMQNASVVLMGDGVYLCERLNDMGVDVMVYLPDAQIRGVDTSKYRTLNAASLVNLSDNHKTWVSW